MNPRSQRIRIVVHFSRVLLFVLAIVLVRVQHHRILARQPGQLTDSLSAHQVRSFFPQAETVSARKGKVGHEVIDSTGKTLGYVLQTSPDSDHLIGFSGPTNMLIAFSTADRIIGLDILSSGDTKEHLEQVKSDESFLGAFNGMTWKEAASNYDIDAVAGATLTSLAIQESIIFRLSGGRPSLRFPNPLLLEQAQSLFESADAIERDANHSSLWHVKNSQNQPVGTILRTSPHTDNIVGYQGPTEALIGFNSAGRVVGISLGRSYDNEQYVSYVREDTYFLSLFNQLNLSELASLDPMEAEIEGVSGATMTSWAVTDGILLAAEMHRQAMVEPPRARRPTIHWSTRDLGTAAVIVCGLTIALTSLRGKKSLRLGFCLVLIVYLGLINGDILSQAMLFGWAQHGIPWANAGGLILLSIAALITPITTRRNVYCTHLCPHGAAQYLLRNRLPWRPSLPSWLKQTLKVVPALVLIWCIVVTMASLPFSLVDVEPFDAWVFRVGGWATMMIAIIGLAASMFIPMAYCRYGCPTGAILNFLRLNARSDQWTMQDWFAVALVATACGLLVAT